MPSVPIQKIRRPDAVPGPLMDSIRELFDNVRRRAYELFEQRGRVVGRDLDDWLRAEWELLRRPESELVETDREFRVRIAAAGLDPGDVEVAAAPNWIVVQGQASRKEEKQQGAVHFSEFQGRKIFRRLELPGPVDSEQVTARLEKGVLEIRAPKAGVSGRKTPLRKRKVAAA